MGQKVAFVTGGAQGIGRAICERLARDGFAVGVADLNLEAAQETVDIIEKADGTATAVKLDVSDRDAFDKAVEGIVEKYGDLNVLVNNAGYGPTTPLDDVTPELFDKVYHINVGGTFWGIQAARKQFNKLGHAGKIINASSQAGVVGNPLLSLYSSTKFAIRGLTHSLAQELAAEGITINCYAPGIVKTPMMFGIAHQTAVEAGKSDEWGMEQYSQYIAMGQLTEPEEIANAISFLASDDCSCMTGQTMVIDGGMQFH